MKPAGKGGVAVDVGVAEGIAETVGEREGLGVAGAGVSVSVGEGVRRSGGVAGLEMGVIAAIVGVPTCPVGTTPEGCSQAAKAVPVRVKIERIQTSFLRANAKKGEMIDNFVSHQAKGIISIMDFPQG